jgi:type II protein arginine methyltransferase
MYLPSNSELQISLWRLTNKRQVWYEWYAESFMPVSYTATAGESDSSPKISRTSLRRFPSIDGRGSVLTTMTTSPVVSPSPLIDAVDVFPFDRKAMAGSPQVLVKEQQGVGDDVKSEGVVKIGQTALHNPGGRSSWIGL